MNRPRERRLALPDLTLAAVEWGDACAPPLLALHGWLDNAGSFATLAPLLVGGLARRPLVGGTPTWPGRSGALLTEPTRLELLHLLRAGDTLLGRWRVP